MHHLDAVTVVTTMHAEQLNKLVPCLFACLLLSLHHMLFAPPAGSISVPGLSSFSFIHGALVGGAVILLLAADKLTPQQQQAGDQQVLAGVHEQNTRTSHVAHIPTLIHNNVAPATSSS
jgi:hypothetical protein